MTVSARRLGMSEATGLMISIAAPTATMILNVRLSEDLGTEYFTVEVTLTARTAGGCPTIRLVGENFRAAARS
jgi:hypothetical protein